MAKKTTKTVKAVKKTVKAKPKAAKSATAPAPARYPLVPYLTINDAKGAIAWYKTALNAKVVSTQPAGDKIMHAELKVTGEPLYLSDLMPGSDMADASRAGSSVTISLWNKNAKKLYDSCVANGAKVLMPYADQFWGDTYGVVRDPYGHTWSFSTRSKLSKKELDAMRAEAMKSFGGA